MALRPFIVALALATALLAQSKPAPPIAEQNEAQKAAALWHDRAEHLTNSNEEDSWRIGVWRAAMNARLAEAWWKDDPVRAKQWLNEAYEEVTFRRQNESEEDRNERLLVASTLYEVFNHLDSARADKLSQAILAENKKTLDPESRQVNALGLQVGIMNAIIHSSEAGDIPRMEALAEQAIQLPGNQTLITIISVLRWHDPAFANPYYIRALKAAVASGDYDNIISLMQAAFPYFGNPVDVSDAARSQAAEIIGQFLAQVPKSQQDSEKYCEKAPEFASHLLPQLPPAQQGVIQASLAACKNISPRSTDDENDMDACTTSDACLKLAAEADTPSKSAGWKNLATIRAVTTEHAPLRAMDILDSLTDDEKKFSPQWKENYDRYSREAFDQLYKVHDTTNIQRVINHAPAELRADIVMNFVDTIRAGKSPDVAYARTMLTEVRGILESAPSQRTYTYLALVMSYSRLLPEEAPQALAFAIDGLNQIHCPEETPAPKKTLPVRCGLPGDDLNPIPLPPMFLERDEAFTLAAIKKLDDPKALIAFRLGLLQTALHRYDEEMQKIKVPAAKADTRQASATH